MSLGGPPQHMHIAQRVTCNDIMSVTWAYSISSIYHKSVLIGRQHFDCLDMAMIGGYMQSCLVILYKVCGVYHVIVKSMHEHLCPLV